MQQTRLENETKQKENNKTKNRFIKLIFFLP